MALNRVYASGRTLTLAVASGTVSGDPVLVGSMTGVALTDRDSAGNATVDFGGVYNLTARGIDDAGNSAIAVGNPLYFVSGDSPVLSKKASGHFFGYALETGSAGSNTTIKVVNLPGAGGGMADIPPLTPADQALLIRNETGGNLVAGDLIYISGWNETHSRWLVTKADADAAGRSAQYVMTGTLATATNGEAFRTYRLTGLNTNGLTVGDPIYLDTTAGGWVAVAPTGADDINQIVGRVAVVSATVGEIEFDLVSNSTVLIGTNELQALAVTAAKLAADAVTTAKILNLAVTKAKSLTFFSTEQTGNGNPQNIAHGLGAVPAGVLVIPSVVAAAMSLVQGAHDATNAVVTCTNADKYYVFAWA